MVLYGRFYTILICSGLNTIQSLRVNYGEIEETLNLSIHYHKLIQEWSEL
ncbi:hypothetical protein [Aliarcobacter butzleri]|nr:hypothetical protein [Aliarcobacter butzleri]MCT7595901.1 hypothetical protein [Aliarcobacter butzleri]MCT7600434.1 hypothetical protein [Aliarcobacter butzleri]